MTPRRAGCAADDITGDDAAGSLQRWMSPGRTSPGRVNIMAVNGQ
jgi:hypothetical protein